MDFCFEYFFYILTRIVFVYFIDFVIIMNNISDPLATMMIKITNNDEQSSSLDYCIDEIQHSDSDQKQSCFINSFSNMMATNNNNIVDGDDDDDNDQKQQTFSECDDLFSQYRLECEKWLLDDSLIASLDQEVSNLEFSFSFRLL